jgi:hypothetical protein
MDELRVCRIADFTAGGAFLRLMETLENVPWMV